MRDGLALLEFGSTLTMMLCDLQVCDRGYVEGMITYNKIAWGLPLLFRMYGSAFPRSFPPAAISAGITVAFYLAFRPADEAWWRHPYPYQVFAYVVGFIVIFRWGFRLLQSSSLSMLKSELLHIYFSFLYGC